MEAQMDRHTNNAQRFSHPESAWKFDASLHVFPVNILSQ